MKFKTTKKAIMNGYDKVIRTSYCSLQSMLNCEDPIAYTTRREGWGADVYGFGNVAIVTGYAPFGNVCPSYDINNSFEKRAQEIKERDWREYSVLRENLALLICEYIEKVI